MLPWIAGTIFLKCNVLDANVWRSGGWDPATNVHVNVYTIRMLPKRAAHQSQVSPPGLNPEAPKAIRVQKAQKLKQQ